MKKKLCYPRLKLNHVRFDGMFISLIVIISLLVVAIKPVHAVPSYARQTNMACNACHTAFPQLTSFGRMFKLNGYNIIGSQTIDATDEKGKTNLKMLVLAPLSIMFQASLSHINTTPPDQQNYSVTFPQQLSLFYAGSITPKLGTFIQITYDGPSGTLGLDNTDIRYANHVQLAKRDLTYGFTLNNNPTVQDVWNSTLAWGFPFASSSVAPAPLTSTLLEESLGQQVAGLGAYGLYNNLVYVEFTAYRSAQLGAPSPPDITSSMIIKGIAPYWRLALQKQLGRHYFEIGTYGISANMYPNGITGETDKYLDYAFDLQFEYMFSKATFTLHSTLIHEKQTLDATFESEGSENRSNNLTSFKADANIYFQKGYGFSLGYFFLTGDKDSILYGSSPFEGSYVGKPDSHGIIAQVDYTPWYNTRFSLQYLVYSKFNGSVNDYDGAGRNAMDNNTLYLLVWVNF